MRVLLDENMDWRLRRFLDSEHEVGTVAECGWSGKRNGDLVAAAEIEFDVLITLDRNLRFQQDLERRDLAFIIIEARSSRRSDIEPLMKSVLSVLKTVQNGRVYTVSL